MAKYKGNTTGYMAKSNRACHCAVCHNRIETNESHFRLLPGDGRYPFKLCRSCLTTASSKVNNRWRVAQRKQARLLAEFDMGEASQ